MRALMLRRTAFLAVLVTGFALIGSAVHSVSGMDRELQLAAVSNQERPTFVRDQHSERDCDGWRERPSRRI